MPDQLQLRGGTTAEHTSFTGASKEVTIDTTKKTAVVHDASTAGGNPLMREDGANSALINGSATEPALAFAAGDADNGIYSPGADQVAISTAGTGRLFVDASGRLLVGTSSSFTLNREAALQVAGGTGASAPNAFISATRFGTTSGGGEFILGASYGSNGNQGLVPDDFGVGLLRFTGSDGANGRDIATVAAFVDGTSAATQMPGRIVFSTNPGTASATPQARMIILSDGKVGINKTDPANLLHVGSVVGDGISIGAATAGTITRETEGLRITGVSTNKNISFVTSGSEACRIDTSGRLLIGATSARANFFNSTDTSVLLIEGASSNAERYLAQVYGAASGAAPWHVFAKHRSADIGGTTLVNDDDQLGGVSFQGADGTHFVEGARILSFVDGTAAANEMPGRLVFYTNSGATNASPAERMRITSNGNINHTAIADSLYGFSTFNDTNTNTGYGVLIQCGRDDAAGTNYAVGISDGDGTNQGYITFSGGTVTYGAFTAHHPCVLPEEDNETGYPYGTLVETVAIEYTEKDGVATERGIRYTVRKTQTANSKAVLGAYGSSMNGGPGGETNLHQALVLGDGHILCNNSGGNIKVGDGICSSAVAGIGQKATATPSMIIGIAQEDVTFDGDETKLVPVQYGLQQFTPWQD